MADKLYIVTRADLPPGSQAVQGIHAARQYTHEHPEIERTWFEKSNHLAFLCVQDEAELTRLIWTARKRGITHSIFREPDLDNCITAVAFEPGERGRRICSGIQLALQSEARPSQA